jgi:hypothetical protein
MRKLYKYFLSARKDLKWLLLLSILTYFLIELVLIRYDELFVGAYIIGQFFSKLSISYISAFVFYFIVVHIKAQKDKENVYEWVGHKAYSIITDAHLFIQPLMQINEKKAKFEDLKENELSQLLKSINRTAKQAPYIVNGENASWLEWYEYLKKSTEDSIDEILVRYAHLDSEFIKILSRIENSLFFYQWNLLYNFEYDKTFEIYKIQIQTYLRLINDLQVYADSNFKKFQFRTSEFVGYVRK